MQSQESGIPNLISWIWEFNLLKKYFEVCGLKRPYRSNFIGSVSFAFCRMRPFNHFLPFIWLFASLCFFEYDAMGSPASEKFEEAIKDSIALDFSIYNRDEEFYINIISEDGYKICDGRISRSSLDEISCIYDKELLRHGDNTFFITVYSTRRNNIVLQTTSHFFYDEEYSFLERVKTLAKNKKTWLTLGVAGGGGASYCMLRNIRNSSNRRSSIQKPNLAPPRSNPILKKPAQVKPVAAKKLVRAPPKPKPAVVVPKKTPPKQHASKNVPPRPTRPSSTKTPHRERSKSPSSASLLPFSEWKFTPPSLPSLPSLPTLPSWEQLTVSPTQARYIGFGALCLWVVGESSLKPSQLGVRASPIRRLNTQTPLFNLQPPFDLGGVFSSLSPSTRAQQRAISRRSRNSRSTSGVATRPLPTLQPYRQQNDRTNQPRQQGGSSILSPLIRVVGMVISKASAILPQSRHALISKLVASCLILSTQAAFIALKRMGIDVRGADANAAVEYLIPFHN